MFEVLSLVLLYWQPVTIALILSFLHAWSTFYYKKLFGWRRYVIKNLILKEFRLGVIPEFLIMLVFGILFVSNALLVEMSLLAVFYLLSGVITMRTGRLSLNVT
jgi:hypothetical protein